MRLRSAFSAAACFLLAASVAFAQGWPERPIRIVLPFPPGGPSDMVIRLAAEKMQPHLKQPLVIENKPGAGGNLGSAEVARAAPDGHTWLWATDTIVTVNPHVYAKLGFKPDDLLPVTIGSSFTQTLVCNPSQGIRSVADLLRQAKAKPLSYASGGAGVPGHLAMELLLSQTGVAMTHVPYKGPAAAMQDVIGGQVSCGFLAGPTVLPQVQAGKLIALATSGAKRSPATRDVPTFGEAGVAGYDATFWLVLYAPRGTPESVTTRFGKLLVDALNAPDVVEKLKVTDQAVVGSSPAEAASVLGATSKKWGAVAKRIELRLD